MTDFIAVVEKLNAAGKNWVILQAANMTSGAAQVLVSTEPTEAQPAPEEIPVSSKVVPTDTPMEE
jgi:hypothetical protein